jgi:hypothetical protein
MLKWDAYDATALEPEPETRRVDRRCVGCASNAPLVSSFTLISSKHGWRLHRARSEESARMDWFCPTCWAARRHVEASNDARPGSDSPPRGTASRSTGTLDMTSTICGLLATKLRSAAMRGPAVDRLVRALDEIELEVSTWSATTGTPERRRDVFRELRALDALADGLIASNR